jgi:hypothetical protein
MTKEQRVDLENIKRLLSHGRFEITGLECLALVNALKTIDTLLKLDAAPIPVPVAKTEPIKEIKKKKVVKDDNKSVKSI